MKNEKTLDQIFCEMKDLHVNFLTAAEQFVEKKKEPKFKAGDFLFEDYSTGFLFIFNGIINDRSEISCPVSFINGSFSFNKKDHTFVNFEKVRFATDSEKQFLLDKLHENGKDWNAEKCEIVDYKWKPERGQWYYTIAIVEGEFVKWDIDGEDEWRDSKADNRRLQDNLVFRTEQLRDEAMEKMKELLKNVQHF